MLLSDSACGCPVVPLAVSACPTCTRRLGTQLATSSFRPAGAVIVDDAYSESSRLCTHQDGSSVHMLNAAEPRAVNLIPLLVPNDAPVAPSCELSGADGTEGGRLLPMASRHPCVPGRIVRLFTWSCRLLINKPPR